MPCNPNNTQPTIRSLVRQRRNQLSLATQSQHSALAQKQFQSFLTANPDILPSNLPVKVAAFLSQDGELGTAEVIQFCHQHPNFQMYLPAIGEDHNMVFGYYPIQAQLENNRLGMQQPKETRSQPRIRPENLDLVLTPLVAYDANGFRVGMGGGFYDRAFAGKKAHHPPYLIGWTHSCQQVSKIDVNQWDIPLDFLISENGWQTF